MGEIGKKAISTREAFGKAILELGASVENLVVLDGDISRSTYTVEFSPRDFPAATSMWGLLSKTRWELQLVWPLRDIDQSLPAMQSSPA